MRTITRAIVRSDTQIVYTQGFNPHPRLSLPLPRNVGLASEDELFCVRILPPSQGSAEEQIKDSIAVQLPTGLNLKSITISEGKTVYRPTEVEYLVSENPANGTELAEKVERLQNKIKTSEPICVQRKINAKGQTKEVDLQAFLKSFEIIDKGIRVICKVLPSGTIRPDEILNLLDIDSDKISSAIIRKKVVWAKNK